MDVLTFYCSFCRKNLNTSCLLTDFKQGTTLCNLCGLVIEDRIIDFTEEIRKFSSEGGADKNLSRLNGGVRNDNRADGGLALAVSGASSTAGRMAQRMGVNSGEKNKVTVYRFIREWAILLNVPAKFQARANEGFGVMAAQVDNFKGRSIECTAAAVLLRVCKGSDAALTPQKISEVCNVKIEDLKREYKHVRDYVKVDAQDVEEFNYCRELCSALEITSLAAVSAAKKIKELGLLDGKHPRTCAAVAVSLALNLQQGSNEWKDMTKYAKIGEATIKKGLKTIEPSLKEILSVIEHHLPVKKLAAFQKLQ